MFDLGLRRPVDQCYITDALATGTSSSSMCGGLNRNLPILKRRLDDPEVHCFLLTFPVEENLRRVERRQAARAIDEREFEHLTLAQERRALQGWERCGRATLSFTAFFKKRRLIINRSPFRTRVAPAGASRPKLINSTRCLCTASCSSAGPGSALRLI
jgi:hypothetical protein